MASRLMCIQLLKLVSLYELSELQQAKYTMHFHCFGIYVYAFHKALESLSNHDRWCKRLYGSLPVWQQKHCAKQFKGFKAHVTVSFEASATMAKQFRMHSWLNVNSSNDFRTDIHMVSKPMWKLFLKLQSNIRNISNGRKVKVRAPHHHPTQPPTPTPTPMAT